MEIKLLKNIITLINSDDTIILEKLLNFHDKIEINEYHFIEGMNITFLGYAVINECYEVGQVLINHGASLDEYIQDFPIPAYIAKREARSGYKLIVSNLFDDSLLTNDGIDNFFTILIKTNNTFLIEKVKNTINVNAINLKNQSILWFASSYQNPELVLFLISKGANPYEADNEGVAPIHLIIKDDIRLQSYNFSYLDHWGNNLLMIALEAGNLDLAHRILIDYQDFSFTNQNKVSVLELMIKKLDKFYIKMLFEQRESIFLNLRPLKGIVSELIKKDLKVIVVKMITDYEDKINFNKIIDACIINDELEVFCFVRPIYIVDYEQEFGLFEALVKHNAIKILVHVINQNILANEYITKKETILSMAKILNFKDIFNVINKQ